MLSPAPPCVALREGPCLLYLGRQTFSFRTVTAMSACLIVFDLNQTSDILKTAWYVGAGDRTCIAVDVRPQYQGRAGLCWAPVFNFNMECGSSKALVEHEFRVRMGMVWAPPSLPYTSVSSAGKMGQPNSAASQGSRAGPVRWSRQRLSSGPGKNPPKMSYIFKPIVQNLSKSKPTKSNLGYFLCYVKP